MERAETERAGDARVERDAGANDPARDAIGFSRVTPPYLLRLRGNLTDPPLAPPAIRPREAPGTRRAPATRASLAQSFAVPRRSRGRERTRAPFQERRRPLICATRDAGTATLAAKKSPRRFSIPAKRDDR